LGGCTAAVTTTSAGVDGNGRRGRGVHSHIRIRAERHAEGCIECNGALGKVEGGIVSLFEHDVDVAGRGQVRADGVEHVLRQVLVVDFAGLGLELDRGVRLEIALGVEGA
jgi:hypothetical protein